MQGRAVVIGVGLSNASLSPRPLFQGRRENVGRSEIARLLGAGRGFGSGPLAAFLRSAAAAQPGPALVLLESRVDGPRSAATTSDDPDELVDPVVDLVLSAEVLRTRPGRLPWRELIAACAQAAGCTPAAVEAGEAPLRFLVVGTATDAAVHATASFLRTALGFAEVAVSPHLVGSATREAHVATLSHGLPLLGVQVLLDLEQAARFVGVPPEHVAPLACRPCELGPPALSAAIQDDRRRVIELLCLRWTQAELRPLQGGFSQSLLLLAAGRRGDAQTEPAVLKIDSYAQMRRELDGYYLVKDLLGKHVPAFGFPVGQGDWSGVSMELATMGGQPETLQDVFGPGGDPERGLELLRQALSLLVERLYRNTRERGWVAPCRALGLHARRQQTWLAEHTARIVDYAPALELVPAQLAARLEALAGHDDALEAETCLTHGDLNLANVICDRGGNTWFIDWTHCARSPSALDFAKLESDLKFVVARGLTLDDLPRLTRLEDALLADPRAAQAQVEDDPQLAPLVEAVRAIRGAYLALEPAGGWLVYRIALLRYALHTLSFDARLDRGDCQPPQLAWALRSVQRLLDDLAADPFHTQTRGARPPSYPPRQRIPLADAPWVRECPAYAPPYHVDLDVLAHDWSRRQGGWAGPETWTDDALPEGSSDCNALRDAQGRPLHPLGRTGIAGRGLLGRWGPNPAVGAVLTRARDAELELLLIDLEGDQDPQLPQGFVRPGEPQLAALARVLGDEVGVAIDPGLGQVLSAGYAYDPRETDHAWVELTCYLFHDEAGGMPGVAPDRAQAGRRSRYSVAWKRALVGEVVWRPLRAATVNALPPKQARTLRAAIQRLLDRGALAPDTAERLLAKTG